MAKKLAIAISGAVSLGCYEAGVLYEIIRAIQHHNENETDEKNHIKIDVLTGASAGGMTAAIVVQKLLFEASSLQEPYNNSLYNAWVKDANFEGLFHLQHGEDQTHSILSSNHVEKISKKHLTDRYKSQLTPKQEPHLAAADTIKLGLALTNLNGVDYIRKLYSGGSFTYTRYQDKLLNGFAKNKAEDDRKSKWEIIRNAAVACGAFPFAFRTKELVRHHKEFQSKSRYLPPIPSKNFPSPTQTFTYTDGGTFENQPLGIAKNLVEELDPSRTSGEERYYLFVSPGELNGTSWPSFNESSADFGGAAKAIIFSIFNQARFQDWITAEQLNEKISMLDDRASQLSDALINHSITAESLKISSSALLSLLFKNDEALTAAKHRLRVQYKNEYDQLIKQTNEPTADAWIEAILTFETAADLGDKDEMLIFDIIAAENELASGKLVAFLGFFDQCYRDHDYDVGRNKAREFIQNCTRNNNLFPHYPKNNSNNQLEPWMNIREVNENLNGLELNNVDINLRKKFRGRLIGSADSLLDKMGFSWVIRKAINYLFIKKKINDWLEIS